MTDVLIVGAGVSGLSAAVHLHRQGLSVKLLEARDHIGGRVWTDLYEGYLLDHGFQILLTEYPECKSLLDYNALDLRKFDPGAMILDERGMLRLSDPYRDPARILSMFFSRVGSFSDKYHISRLRRELKQESIETIFEREEKSTLSALQEYGFSDRIINLFFKPFMQGVFLENELSSSRRMFDFTYKMFSSGNATVPARGMAEIPRQLAAQLPEGSILLNQRVARIDGHTVYTTDAQQFEAKSIILATESGQLQSTEATQGHGVTNVYFEAPEAPLPEPLLVLNATESALINNMVPMSNLSEAYAPLGKTLISVSVNGTNQESDEIISNRIKQELAIWFGHEVTQWQHLKTYKIYHALPNQDKVINDPDPAQLKHEAGYYLAGDYLLNGSLNAAMKSGRLAAEAVTQDLAVTEV